MPEHYTKNTLECTAWCAKCQRQTQHRVDAGRRGPCLDCIGFVIGNCRFRSQPKCMHCDRPFPSTTQVDTQLSFVEVLLLCPKCGLMTPFAYDRDAGLSQKQRAARAKRAREQRNPTLF